VLVRDTWEPLRSADTDALRSLTLDRGLHRDVWVGVTQLGAPLLLEAAALVGAVLLRKRRLSAYLLVTVLGAELLSSMLKVAVDRARPCLDLASCPATSSYPSGHATGAAAFWAAAAVLLVPRLGHRAWLLLVVPVVVALTRVLLGVHYPSDVLAGLVVGGCWAAAWTVLLAALRGRSVEDGLA
jgi:undecaprenyl-diphosphatase